jgi:hypothetical protein
MWKTKGRKVKFRGWKINLWPPEPLVQKKKKKKNEGKIKEK